MKLIDNLTAINNCKEDIKTALINKGVNMDGVSFSGYAGKIESLKLDSGDTPSPTPSADYIYSNANLCDVDGNLLVEDSDIINFTPYEIKLDDTGKFEIELICPEEIPSYEGGSYYDIVLTIDIPTSYEISNFEYYDAGTTTYYVRDVKPNPRHSIIIRNGVEYKSYVRQMDDNKDIASEYLAYEPFRYKITINKI
jgi:hypothetical protein